MARLRSFPCEFSDVCETRDACVIAFGHHVKGVEVGKRLRRQLDGGVDGGDPAARLLEMNVEVEEGRKAMPACEQRVASLRRKHKL